MKRILYFINGPVPTEEERLEAESMGAIFRNARASSGDYVETCDAVAGNVPDMYKGFPAAIAPLAAVVGEGGSSLDAMDYDALLAYAASKGITIPGNMKKPDTIRALIRVKEQENAPSNPDDGGLAAALKED